MMIRPLQPLHVYRTYFPDPPGGLQEAIRQITLATSAKGYSPRIFALSPRPEPRTIEMTEGLVVRSRSWAAPASCDLGGLEAFKLFNDYARLADVLHYHFPWPFADLLEIMVRPHVPAVMTYHSDIVRQRLLGWAYAPLMWTMLRRVRIIVATSPSYARTSAVLSHPSICKKVRVIPLGISECSYPKFGDPCVLDRINIRRDEEFLLFIGVLRYYKGLHHLVHAAGNVGCKIVIAGTGPEEKKLREIAHQCGAPNVVFAGRITDEEKVALLQSCRAVVLPSHLRSEAFGMVLVEASMFGRPMITCEIGTGTSYVNVHRETGLVVPPEQPEELAAAMNALLTNDSISSAFGKAARTRYEQKFSGPALGKAYSELYQEVAQHH